MGVTDPPTSRWRARVFKLALVLLALVVGELAARYLLGEHLESWNVARRGLAGEGVATFQNTVGQSYLNYVPAPGYGNRHGPQHNEHGYRGERVALRKAPGSLRIVCLGGSTTYGWGVWRADESYPAQLQRILAADLPPGFEKVEVINAGLPWGTSAELLNHYHFKYHYYRPDVVIVHTGLNDGMAFDMEAYQPDYDHWRQQMRPPLVLPAETRWLARSHLVGLFLVPALLGPRPEVPSFNRSALRPATDWYEGRFDRSAPRSVPDQEIAFVHNIRSLVHEVRRDGAIALVMPVEWRTSGISEPELERFVVSTGNSLRYTRYNAELLRGIADDLGVVFVPFPQEKLPPSRWVELMHLGPEGSLDKARHVAGFVSQALGDAGSAR